MSGLIQPRQIQNKENVKTNVPSSAHGQLQHAQSGAVESKHPNIYIFITYELFEFGPTNARRLKPSRTTAV